MTRHTIASRLAPALLCVASMLATLGFGAAGAVADELPPEDTDAKGSITATFEYNGEKVEGSEFYLYKVANWDKDNPDEPLSSQLTDEFKDEVFKDVNWSLLDTKYEADENGNKPFAEDWYDLATTLFQTMKANQFGSDYVATGTTDADGVVTFTGLSDGVYFLISPLYALPKAVYSAQLVSVPEGTAAEYEGRQVQVSVKGTPWSGKDPIHVKKIWNDSNAPDRPTSIKVTLFYQFDEDGPFEEYETVELNAANNWSYEWTRLPESMDYVVQETEVPEGYTMHMEVDRVSATTSYWTITNTKPATPTPTPPAPTPTPAQTGAEIATLCAVAGAALVIGVLMIVKARRSGSQQ
ncbi:Cna B-type domain-containing protein [Bifidobacterium cuniculi]|uniref:Collagen adhesin n=1 Tax=Bifidobacterium cuniculi TaxID=1688 RepID=A0A087AWP5_9BIFI|nr:Cna B-type domain-containing protein [Bifidobacterium cuniculi]KFI63195.1 collagen adhesin [Bifidobacterium cuniculi]